MIHRFLLPLAMGAALFAQVPDLKTVLNLSDNQVQALVLLQQQKAQELQPMVQQLQQAQQKLQQLLVSNPDPALVGRLFIGINMIGQQVRQAEANFEQQARSVLRPDQGSQVASLGEVLKLQLAAQQAVGLGLLSAPN